MKPVRKGRYAGFGIFLIAVLLVSCQGTGEEQTLDEQINPTEEPGGVVLAEEGPFIKNQEIGEYQSWDLDLGDLNGDGYPDLVTASLGQDDPKVWFNDGTGLFSAGGQVFPACARVELGDFDGDQALDILIAEWQPDQLLWTTTISIWLNDGKGRFAERDRLDVGDGTQSAILADINGDGSLDLFAAGTGQNEVWINNGEGVFSKSGQDLPTGLDAAVGVGDLDGDGDPDVLSGEWEGPPVVWMNDGAGNFTKSEISIIDEDLHIHGLALGDLDGDGDLDAFVTLANRDPHQIWINDGAGSFSLSQSLPAGLGHAVSLGDLDQDGDLDGVSGHGYQLGGYVRIWWNDGAAHFTDSSLSLGDGFASAVALGDLDLDGDLDFISAQNAWGEEDGLPDLVWLNTKEWED